MTTRCLSFHQRYGCRDRGACCTSQWPIPVEADRLQAIRAALVGGILRPVAGTTEHALERANTGQIDAPALLGTTEAGCVFYRSHGRARCEVHRVLGHGGLPLACRQFPRVVVRDPRGVSVTLSHYCPTAAETLGTREPVTIVHDGPAFPPAGEYVGLDAASALPPLLAPEMLMDWDAWWEFERRSVSWIVEAPGSCRDAVDTLATIVEHARTWRPGHGSLVDRVHEAFDRVAAIGRPPAPPADQAERGIRVQDVISGISDAWRSRAPRLRWLPHETDHVALPPDSIVRRYVASHAFANWTVHLGGGLRTWWRSVDAALLVIESGLDVREGDLVLRHLADPDALARVWSRSEER